MSENKKEEFKTKIDIIAKEIKKTGKIVADKTAKMADVASARIKLQSCTSKLNAEYGNLGRLSYNKLVNDCDNADKISASIERIDELRAEVEAMKKELDEKLKILNTPKKEQ